jgi:transcriptional regulator with XRE-family HTH domain
LALVLTRRRVGAVTAMQDRVRLLRVALRMTQEELGQASGLARVEVNRLESGANQGLMVRIQKGLARAVGVTLDEMNAYLEGDLSLDGLFARRCSKEADPLPERAAAVQWATLASYPSAVLARALRHPVRLSYDAWIDQLRVWRAEHEANASAPASVESKPSRGRRRA